LFRDLEQRNAELEARENALHQQTRVLRATLDNMTDGISLIDGELRLLAWNDRFIELFGFPPDLIREGMPMTDIHRFDVERGQLTPAAAKSLVEGMLRIPKGQSFTAQTETADGKVILLRRRPLTGGGYVTTYTDETERVQALDKAEKALNLLEAVMDAVPAILHVKDQNLRYRFVNRYFLDFFGLQREHVIGRKMAEVLRPEWLTEFQDLGPEVLASGKAISLYEMAIRRADGERIDMLGSKVPLRDEDGYVTHVVTFEIDITERKRIQQALSDSEELYRLLVNQSPYGILLHDEQAIVFINPAGCQMLGASGTEQIVGRHYGEFVAESDRQSGMARLTQILDPGVSVGQTERRLVTLDGREIIVATSGVPFTQGMKRLALVIFVDISELKQAESEIARQREALHQAEKISALGSLLAGVAHELNNPLSVVIGRSIMLGEKQLDPLVAAGIEKIRAAAERCAGIVKSFLAMARQQAQARVPVRIDALMDSSLDFLAYSLDNAGIRVSKRFSSNLPGTLADPDQLSQVFNNLITNAQQALVDWSGPRELHVTADVDRRLGEIRITVSDTGPGIPEDVQNRVFDPFFTTKPMGAGTGIGLALCRGILEAHGGTIAVGKSPSGGASFLVTLPVVEAETGLAGTGASNVVEKSKPISILIVDDEEEIRTMLGDILTADGHRVEEATDGSDALARLADGPYDLVISDLIMPVLDGPGLYAALRAQHPSMAERIVFITGDTLSPTAQEFLKHAGRPVIEKPFMPEEVRRTVRECIM
jgi:two-component system NtrC family sensor kinase